MRWTAAPGLATVPHEPGWRLTKLLPPQQPPDRNDLPAETGDRLTVVNGTRPEQAVS